MCVSKALLGFLLLFVTKCSAVKAESTMDNAQFYIPENCDFSVVGNNSTSSNDCSPVIVEAYPDEYTGILINAPTAVVWPKNFDSSDNVVAPNGNVQGPVKLMLAGVVNLEYSFMGLSGNFSNEVIVVAVDQKTAQSYSGKMQPFGFPTPIPDVPGYAESQKGLPATRYFNIDLFHNLELPLANAVYTVYAILGDKKSNVLTIETKLGE